MLKTLNKFGAHVSAFVVSFGIAMGMSVAYASGAGDIDQVIVESTAQIANVNDLVKVGCYGGGGVSCAAALVNFKKHVDNPSQTELRKAVGPGVVGVALLAFPSFTGILLDSTALGGNDAVQFENNAFDVDVR